MNLQNKFLIPVVTVVVILLIFLGSLVYISSKNDIEKQVTKQLQYSSLELENNIDSFLEAQKDKIELIATQNELSNDELIQMTKIDENFYDLFVINSSGIVVVSSNPERIGLDRSNRTYFTLARNQTYVSPVYFALVPKEYSVAISTPFKDNVLVGSIKLSSLEKLIKNTVELGKTGETLMAFLENNELVYFTKRKFSDISIERLKEEQYRGRPMEYAVNGEEKILLNGEDYRGEKVIAVTNLIEQLNIGMVTKIDTTEAYLPITTLRTQYIFGVIISIFLLSIVIFITIRPISKEIVQITEKVGEITKGKLDVQLNKSSTFELQGLISSLNRILASMKLAILRTGLSKGELGIGDIVQAKEEVEDRYKLLYETSSDAIMTIEPPEWKFTSGNPATLKLFGLKDEEELKKLNPGELSPEKQPDGKKSSEKSKKMIEKAIKEGKVFFEWTHKKYNGKDFKATVLLSKVNINGKEALQATVRKVD